MLFVIEDKLIKNYISNSFIHIPFKSQALLFQLFPQNLLIFIFYENTTLKTLENICVFSALNLDKLLLSISSF